MKNTKIYGFPSHQTKNRTSGVDFARIYNPMTHLNGYKEFKTKIYNIDKKKQDDWKSVAKNYDAVFLNYTVHDWSFAYMGFALREQGKKMILDIDDSIWDVRPDNPTYGQYNANNKRFIRIVTDIINEVDHVTTTSGYLRNIIMNNTKKSHDDITVIPNYIDLDRYKWTYEPKESNEIIIMHFGSSTHFEDLLQAPFRTAMTRIMDQYPNVRFETVGAFISDYRYLFGNRYKNSFGDEDIYKWIDKFPSFMERADIFVSPVEPDRYNKAKSYIKYLEVSSAKVPGVWQDIYQYQEIMDNGANGYLASSEEEWYKALKMLIDSIELRRTIGQNAFQTAKKHQIQDHIGEYADVFRKVLDK